MLRCSIIFLWSILLGFAASQAAELERCPLPVKGAQTTQVGIFLRDMSTGRILADVNSESTFVPASITKSLTVASVLSQLPADLTFSTEIAFDGEVTDSILDGNLIVRASGDPTVDSKFFPEYHGICDSIAVHLKRLGVSRIRGRVIIDFPPMAECRVPDGWMNEDLLQVYGAAHHSMNFRDNRIVFNATDCSTSPRSPKMKIRRVEGSRLSRPRNDNRLDVGKNARGSRTIANPDPSATFDGVLAEVLKANGIMIEESKLPVKDATKTLYVHHSPQFSDIMRSLMFRSDNLMAEGMLRTLAPTRSRESACQRELSLWEARGINTAPIYVEDGSGLSRKNRISPRFLSDVLEWMARSDDGPLYVSFFPRAGREGTMRSTMVGTRLEGRMATKTGSMRGVQCFAGYILDNDGHPTHSVVVMVNGYTCDKGSLKSAIGKYLIDKLNL